MDMEKLAYQIGCNIGRKYVLEKLAAPKSKKKPVVEEPEEEEVEEHDPGFMDDLRMIFGTPSPATMDMMYLTQKGDPKAVNSFNEFYRPLMLAHAGGLGTLGTVALPGIGSIMGAGLGATTGAIGGLRRQLAYHRWLAELERISKRRAAERRGETDRAKG